MKSPKDMRIIQIDITNACVYQCSNCTRFCGHHKKNFFMNFETFKKAVDSMKGYHGTIGIMGGEPTLHPEFERFVSYLHSQLGNEEKKTHHSLVKPQKDFIESILLENKKNSEIYGYTTGKRETIVGAGLWSAMVPTYKKHYELIQDVFKMQAVNDHGNTMYHSPILINRKDLNIPDNEWIKIRDNCWAQDIWSATITPKGAFFCEIAGALDMLFDGPGGWPIEPGWWKRTPDQFGDQLKWCELCGIAIETFTRDANDWVDDISESMYEKLKEIGSPKLNKPERINLVKIENGIISEESKRNVKEIRKDMFFDSFMSRFDSQKTCLFPDKFDLICYVEENIDCKEITDWIEYYENIFSNVVIISKNTAISGVLKDIHIINSDTWGHSFAEALSKCGEENPIIYMDSMLHIDKNMLQKLKETVINPGTLHIADLKNKKSDIVSEDTECGVVAMLHRNSKALKTAGFDFISNADSFEDIVSCWDKGKIIDFNSDMIEDNSELRIQPNKKYAVYGAGRSGRSSLATVKKANSEVIYYSDSDCNKWGENIEGISIISPEELFEKRNEYFKIIIASMFHKEIKEKLDSIGFSEEDYIVYE